MTTACVRVCAEGIKAQNPQISQKELIAKLRERLAVEEYDRFDKKHVKALRS
jgi:hypothetical protein